MSRLRNLSRLCLITLFTQVLGVTLAHSGALSSLYDAVPAPPVAVVAAQAWLQQGEISHPDVLSVRAELAAQREQVAGLNGGQLPPSLAPVPDNLPATAEFQAAARSYGVYLVRHQGNKTPEAQLAKRKRWLQRAYGQKQLDISKAMTPCDSPCKDAAVVAANEPWLKQRAFELRTELRSWQALFDDWKKTRMGNIYTAESRLEALGDPAATNAAGRQLIARYRAAMLEEIALLLSITELSVLRIDAINRGLDGSESDAITGASKKAK